MVASDTEVDCVSNAGFVKIHAPLASGEFRFLSIMNTSSKDPTLNDITTFFGSEKTESWKNSTDSLPEASGWETRDEDGRILCGDLNIRIDCEGSWFYHGSPIGRKEIVKLFSTVLHKNGDDTYWLITPSEKGRILVEDAPFMAVEMTVEGDGPAQKLTFRTNVDEIVTACRMHPLRIFEDSRTGEPSPYILVRDNLEAKLTRSVFYQLVDRGAEIHTSAGTKFGVWSGGMFFNLGNLEDAVT